MKKLPVVIITLLIIINAYLHMNAASDCLDNSLYMSEKYDYKDYHAVECNCPCWKYKQLADRNRCTRCLHFHDKAGVSERAAQKIDYGSYQPRLAITKAALNR